MKIPFKKILIAPYWFEIKEDDKLNAVSKLTGASLLDTQIILIDPDIGDTVAMETLVHEALHCIWHQVIQPSRYTEEMEEDIIWSLAPRIVQMIQDNPELIRWICSANSTTKRQGSTAPTSKSPRRKTKGRG